MTAHVQNQDKPENQDIQAFIISQRKAGVANEQISAQLLQNGWTLEQVMTAMNVNVPMPPAPVVNNATAQTSNAGTPLQVENVQYNMKVKPVESKVGLYMKVLGAALWLTVIFACSFLSSLVGRIAGDETSDLGSSLVVTLSLLIVSTPIFLVAYRKFRAEKQHNPVAVDDLFFKKSVRRNLWVAVVLAAISAFYFIYNVLAGAFLKDSVVNPSDIFTSLIFALGFGSVVWFYWQLHAQTKR